MAQQSCKPKCYNLNDRLEQFGLQRDASEVSKRSLLNINEHCEQGRNKAASQNATI